MTAALISIIVVSFNTRDVLRACLHSVITSEDWHVSDGELRQSHGNLSAEVVLVDNASFDESADMVRQEFPWVHLIANQDNAGFAKANNQGIAASSGEFVLLLNPDTEVIAGAIAKMFEFARQRERVGVVGCQLLNADSSLQPSGRDFPRLGSVWRELLPMPGMVRRATRSNTERRDYSVTSEVDEVSGAVMLIRRTALEAAGGLHEGFFFFGEDVDLCWSLRERGWSVYYLPTARVVHHWGGSRARVGSERISLLAQRSWYLLFRRHRPGWQAVILKATLFPATLLKLAKGWLLDLVKGNHVSVKNRVRLYGDELTWLWRN